MNGSKIKSPKLVYARIIRLNNYIGFCVECLPKAFSLCFSVPIAQTERNGFPVFFDKTFTLTAIFHQINIVLEQRGEPRFDSEIKKTPEGVF